MNDNIPIDEQLPAGEFSTWLSGLQGALRSERSSEVACGDCTACCTSGQFIHVAPDETDALAHIPSKLLFRAPGLPIGHMLMGYDTNGHCPMFKDGKCSIYQHRPRTCRTYDCRIFPATGIELDDADKPAIARQARRWKFNFPTENDLVLHSAVSAAGSFLAAHPDCFPSGTAPRNPIEIAVIAIEIHEVFLRRHAGGTLTFVAPLVEEVAAAIARSSR